MSEQYDFSEDGHNLYGSEPSTPVSSGRKRYNVVDNTQLPARIQLLLEKLKRFYANGEFERTVLPILRDKNPIAVRDLEWLVTNYSKAFPVIYPNPMNPIGELINVHDSYEHHENLWKKDLFDPFQRKDRIHFQANGVNYETTIAQLNFFAWAIQYGVIDWAVAHKEEIKQHHLQTKKARKELIQQNPNREKKRMKLTEADQNRCFVYIHPMLIGHNSHKGH